MNIEQHRQQQHSPNCGLYDRKTNNYWLESMNYQKTFWLKIRFCHYSDSIHLGNYYSSMQTKTNSCKTFYFKILCLLNLISFILLNLISLIIQQKTRTASVSCYM